MRDAKFKVYVLLMSMRNDLPWVTDAIRESGRNAAQTLSPTWGACQGKSGERAVGNHVYQTALRFAPDAKALAEEIGRRNRA